MTAVSRKIYIYFTCRLTITGTSTAANQACVAVGGSGLRAYPLSSIIENTSLTINGSKMNIQAARVIHPMSAFCHCDFQTNDTFLSGEPTCPDQTQSYDDLAPLGARNPLKMFYDSQVNGWQGRTNNFVVVRNDTSTAGGQALTAIVDVAVISPLYLSPLQYKHSTSSFIHVNTFDIQLQLLATWPNRIWSSSPAATGINIPLNSIQGQINGATSFSSQLGNNCLLFTEYLTPSVIEKVPRMLSYNYVDVQNYITNGPTFAPYASGQVQSNAFQIIYYTKHFCMFLLEII